MIFFLFQNVRTVIEAERVMVKVGLVVIIRPVPTNISSECGMCIQVNHKDMHSGCEILQKNGLMFQQIEQ